MGRKFKDLYKESRRYLSKDDLDEPILAVMDAVRDETIKGDHGDEDKPVLYFRGDIKPMVLNRTNGEILCEAYGADLDDWYGKPVEIYVDPNVMFAGQRKGGVRLRTDVKKSMTLDEAVAACAEVGISKDGLVDRLKELGNTGWNADRDTPVVNKLIEEAKAEAETIPF